MGTDAKVQVLETGVWSGVHGGPAFVGEEVGEACVVPDLWGPYGEVGPGTAGGEAEEESHGASSEYWTASILKGQGNETRQSEVVFGG
jgi:hypothetical protein